LTCGFWNINGLLGQDQQSEKFLLRSKCFKYLNYDILCIAETHLRDGHIFEVPEYEFFGHNRQINNKNRAFGGVGVFVKKNILEYFSVTVLDNNYEGIMWLQLICKITKEIIRICVCYLPPEGSSRKIDGRDFYDVLLSQIFMYQNNCQFTICGDFNSRVGNLCDFIEGIDHIQDREVIDHKINSYGDMLIELLVSSNCCMVNGRKGQNDFTSVSVKGKAVVDYCISSHEGIENISDFSVTGAKDVFENAGCLGVYDPTVCCIPDHSLLSWNITTKRSLNSTSNKENSQWNCKHIIYNRKLPEDFCHNVKSKFEGLGDMLNERNVDEVYEEFVKTVKDEMNKKLGKKVVFRGERKGQGKNINKPWWSEKLQNLWKEVRKQEKLWHKSKDKDKSKMKSDMCKAQNNFDREVQKSKREFWFTEQRKLEEMYKYDKTQFWTTIGDIGIANDRKKTLPFSVTDDRGKTVVDRDEVLKVWQEYFKNLLNQDTSNGNVASDVVIEQSVPCDDVGINILNAEITVSEIEMAIKASSKGKACGEDDIPLEVLCNENIVGFLCKMFNECFSKGSYPEVWKKGIICPIPKTNTSDTDPSCYRGITLASSSYKLFCSVLNSRLMDWVEQNCILADEQNGFRRNRSCVDHVTSLVSIIETRLKGKQSTYAAFIDFKKAYDSIDRNHLWHKMENLGLPTNSRIYCAIRNLYNNLKCCVRVHGFKSDWFEVLSGLRQGCVLSPIMFNMYINDLVINLKGRCNGIPIGGENVTCLLYADDVVLLARNEQDLKEMLNVVNQWCMKWNINVNGDKSEVVHFRNKSVEQTRNKFCIGNIDIKKVSKYRYLGLFLHEHLDFSVTAHNVANSANRALGLLIAKDKAYGGMPFKCFEKLYDALVMSVINYGAAIWGHKEYSSINAVHNRACRYFLGVGKYTPNAAVQGDMGLLPPFVHQWVNIARNWCRLVNMSTDRLNRKIFIWTWQFAINGKVKNALWNIAQFFKQNDMTEFLNINNMIDKNDIIYRTRISSMEKYVSKWSEIIESECGSTRNGGNKLRTYRLMKTEYRTEKYVTTILGKRQRASIAKFRCGTAPIRIETGRYEKLDECERLCPFCINVIEDEYHVLFECFLYADLREEFYNRLLVEIELDFNALSIKEKLCSILASDSDFIIRHTAKFCTLLLERRRGF